MVEVGAQTKRELDPTRNQNATKVTMGYDDQIALSDPFFEILPMFLYDFIYDRIYALRHLIRALATGAAGPPDIEIPVFLLDLSRR